MSTRLWITWEHHRRSKELAPAFDCDYVVIDMSGRGRLMRYLASSLKTARLVLAKQWSAVFVQCPSLVLSVVVGFLRNFKSFVYVIDAHNALPNYERSNNKLLKWAAAYAVRKADFVIVTNDELKAAIERFGGTPLILPDKLPHIPERPVPKLLDAAQRPAIVLVCSFAWDEPIEEILEGLVQLDTDYSLFVTGKKSKAGALLRFESDRIKFTDYLPEAEFEALIQHSDLIIDITVDERILVCGAYEAVSVGVPSVLADFPVTRALFRRGTVYAKNSSKDYADAVAQFLARQNELRSEMGAFSGEFAQFWAKQFEMTNSAIQQAEPV